MMGGVEQRAKKRMVAVNAKNYRLGEDHHRAKLSNHEVELLLNLADEGYSQTWLANKFEIGRRTVRDYLAGRKRCQSPAALARAGLTDAERDDLTRLIREGLGWKQLRHRFKVSRSEYRALMRSVRG